MQPDFQVSDDPAAAAVSLLAEVSGQVCITGGSTPRVAYERVAELRPDWSGVEIWFTDERCVPPDHEHSNFRMADEALLSRVSGPRPSRIRSSAIGRSWASRRPAWRRWCPGSPLRFPW